MNSYNTDIFFCNYYNLQSVHFEMHVECFPSFIKYHTLKILPSWGLITDKSSPAENDKWQEIKKKNTHTQTPSCKGTSHQGIDNIVIIVETKMALNFL